MEVREGRSGDPATWDDWIRGSSGRMGRRSLPLRCEECLEIGDWWPVHCVGECVGIMCGEDHSGWCIGPAFRRLDGPPDCFRIARQNIQPTYHTFFDAPSKPTMASVNLDSSHHHQPLPSTVRPVQRRATARNRGTFTVSNAHVTDEENDGPLLSLG